MVQYHTIIEYIKEHYKEIPRWISCNGINGDMPTEITVKDLNEILSDTQQHSFFEIDKAQYPEWSGYGVAPYRICAYLIINPDLKIDIENKEIFIPIRAYPSSSEILTNEIGVLGNFRVFVEELLSFEFETAKGNKGYISYVILTRTDKDEIYPISLQSSKGE